MELLSLPGHLKLNWLPAWSSGYLRGHLITCMVNWLPAWSTGYLHGQLVTCMAI